MIPVSLKDFGEFAPLPFDLYDANGEKMLPAGVILSAKDLGALKQFGLFRYPVQKPIIEEGHEFPCLENNTGLSDAEMLRRQYLEKEQEDALPSLFGETISTHFLPSMQYFFQNLRRGATPDIALCEITRDKLIAEITTKFDQVHQLTQLRVRDHFTYSHTMDVSAISIALAIKAGFEPKEVREIGLAALIHDLGKMMIPKSIMFKPTRLTEREFEVMKLHPGLGYKIIKEMLKLPEYIALPALEHQEMYGGGGYPNNLTGEEIHPYSQVVKVADVYDALTSKRPYKEAIPSSKALKIMISEGAKSFNPKLLEAFIEISNYHEETRYSLAG